MSAPIQISLAAASHRQPLATALREMSRHYGVDADPDAIKHHLHATLLGPASPLRFVVACTDASTGTLVVGFAAIAYFHSLVDPDPRTNGQLLLKELYVGAAHRGSGVGRALMRWIAAHAVERGIARIDWNVRADNDGGRAFYRSLGAVERAERLSYRLDGEALRRLSAP